MKKTNAARLLERLGIEYQLLEYRVDEQDLSAEHVARELGLPSKQVFKTMVLRGDKGGVFVCCIPGNGELDLKRVAQLTGNKKVELVPMKEIFGLTGYVRGGCSPLAMKKQYPTFLDSRALDFDFIVVSAGVRGAQLGLAPKDLVTALRAELGELISPGGFV
ncbi:MAG: Cys-tRNA(Pro) deacylase [Firmicutes bacterium]|nr:Cys-tRNA(Pro) deacylase [Bacillota bacterium]